MKGQKPFKTMASMKQVYDANNVPTNHLFSPNREANSPPRGDAIIPINELTPSMMPIWEIVHPWDSASQIMRKPVVRPPPNLLIVPDSSKNIMFVLRSVSTVSPSSHSSLTSFFTISAGGLTKYRATSPKRIGSTQNPYICLHWNAKTPMRMVMESGPSDIPVVPPACQMPRALDLSLGLVIFVT